jgi:small subunit ribosomal protein S17
MMNTRRRLQGVVTSNKMQKTVTVELSRTFRHPLYGKVVNTARRIKAHDELGCHEGDEVIVVESRPMSKTKRWVVQEITSRNIHAEVEEMIAEQNEGLGEDEIDGLEAVAESSEESEE